MFNSELKENKERKRDLFRPLCPQPNGDGLQPKSNQKDLKSADLVSLCVLPQSGPIGPWSILSVFLLGAFGLGGGQVVNAGQLRWALEIPNDSRKYTYTKLYDERICHSA